MRRIAIAAAAGAALILAALSAAWFYAAQGVRAEIAGWTERQQEAGILFAHGDLAVGGFPFRVDLTIPDPVLASADGARRWEAAALSASAPIWRMDRLDWDLAGRHRYRFTGSDGLQHEIVLDMLSADARTEFESGLIRAAEFAAASVRITGTAPGEAVIDGLQARLSVLPENAADLKSESGALLISARSVTLPSGPDAAGHEPIRSVDLSLAVTGPLPWSDSPDALLLWRDAGGTVELRRLAFAWSELAVEGEGALVLDSRMRPEGVVTLRLDGLQAVLQKMTAEGALPPEDAETVRRMAGDLASPDATVPGRLLVVVSAQDGKLAIRDRTYGILHPITAP
jgi:hypothetical protein